MRPELAAPSDAPQRLARPGADSSRAGEVRLQRRDGFERLGLKRLEGALLYSPGFPAVERLCVVRDLLQRAVGAAGRREGAIDVPFLDRGPLASLGVEDRRPAGGGERRQRVPVIVERRDVGVPIGIVEHLSGLVLVVVHAVTIEPVRGA